MAKSVEESKEILRQKQVELRAATTKGETIAILQSACSQVGYKPVVRALVMAQPEENWFRF